MRAARWITLAVAVAVGGLALPAPTRAQDFYDPSVLRTVAIQFHDANWPTLLPANYASQTNILADLVVEGVTYPNVGVRIRGNTSYTALPSGSQKWSLNVDVDFVDTTQAVLGYKNLNFNNGFHDPTFCREVVYNNYVAQYLPNPRANHVVVTLNGTNWGVYNNVQQFDKTMLGPWFADAGGLRVKCANNPNGPGLRYVGATANLYPGYEVKDPGGFADPYVPLIALCNTVTNGSLATWQDIDDTFAIDPSIWSLVSENILTDDDSYVNKGADFMVYRNPTDGRSFLLQTDANETFTQTSWSPTLNFGAANKPVLSHVLAVAELRQRYMAHYRALLADLTWAKFEPLFTAQRNLIDAAVQADTKKLYSYTLFQNNFTSTVLLPYPGLAGGTLIGVQPFVEQRATLLGTNAELSAQGPVIDSIQASDDTPDPAQAVTISAWVRASTSAIAGVDLYYRPAPTAGYETVSMVAQGGGRYAVVLPVSAVPGQRVQWYVRATAANAYASQTYLPVHSELNPRRITYTFGASGGMRITEWMYSGTSGEFVEFTNVSDAPIDLAGWSFDDDHEVAGSFDLGALGVVQPHESVVITEAAAGAFRTAWGLGPEAKVLGGLGTAGGNNLARNDEINLYDASDVLVDRLTFGDQTIAGSIRTQNVSGQACCQSIGQNEATAWVLSVLGDGFGSRAATTGEVGSPGVYSTSTCSGCSNTSVPVVAAGVLSLGAPSPNPFSTRMQIRFTVARGAPVRLIVYDAAGREVRELVNAWTPAGSHAAAWDGMDGAGRAAPAGLYFARLVAGDESVTRRFIRMR